MPEVAVAPPPTKTEDIRIKPIEIHRGPEKVLFGPKEGGKSKISEQYDDKPWKQESDNLFDTRHAVETWRELQDKGLVPDPTKDLTFVGVASNVPTFETAMFKEDLHTRTGRSTFLIGDYLNLPIRDYLDENVKPYTDKDHQFSFIRWDAGHLPIPDGSADVIYDRNGYLWHCAVDEKDPQKVLDAIREYNDKLAPGGCIIIDNIQGFDEFLDAIIVGTDFAVDENGEIVTTDPELEFPGQMEISTVDAINDRSDYGNVDLWKEIAKHFETRDVGQGLTSVRVLQKSSKEGVKTSEPKSEQPKTKDELQDYLLRSVKASNKGAYQEEELQRIIKEATKGVNMEDLMRTADRVGWDMLTQDFIQQYITNAYRETDRPTAPQFRTPDSRRTYEDRFVKGKETLLEYDLEKGYSYIKSPIDENGKQQITIFDKDGKVVGYQNFRFDRDTFSTEYVNIKDIDPYTYQKLQQHTNSEAIRSGAKQISTYFDNDRLARIQESRYGYHFNPQTGQWSRQINKFDIEAGRILPLKELNDAIKSEEQQSQKTQSRDPFEGQRVPKELQEVRDRIDKGDLKALADLMNDPRWKDSPWIDKLTQYAHGHRQELPTPQPKSLEELMKTYSEKAGTNGLAYALTAIGKGLKNGDTSILAHYQKNTRMFEGPSAKAQLDGLVNAAKASGFETEKPPSQPKPDTYTHPYSGKEYHPGDKLPDGSTYTGRSNYSGKPIFDYPVPPVGPPIPDSNIQKPLEKPGWNPTNAFLKTGQHTRSVEEYNAWVSEQNRQVIEQREQQKADKARKEREMAEKARKELEEKKAQDAKEAKKREEVRKKVEERQTESQKPTQTKPDAKTPVPDPWESMRKDIFGDESNEKDEAPFGYDWFGYPRTAPRESDEPTVSTKQDEIQPQAKDKKPEVKPEEPKQKRRSFGEGGVRTIGQDDKSKTQDGTTTTKTSPWESETKTTPLDKARDTFGNLGEKIGDGIKNYIDRKRSGGGSANWGELVSNLSTGELESLRDSMNLPENTPPSQVVDILNGYTASDVNDLARNVYLNEQRDSGRSGLPDKIGPSNLDWLISEASREEKGEPGARSPEQGRLEQLDQEIRGYAEDRGIPTTTPVNSTVQSEEPGSGLADLLSQPSSSQASPTTPSAPSETSESVSTPA